MNWFKKYGWYILISFISAILGGAICISISQKNLGSFADWLSGLGSIAAIAFAYWQIHEQKVEYENDKREQEKIKQKNNQPLFSLSNTRFFKKGVRNCYWQPNDFQEISKKIDSSKINYALLTENKGCYELINITNSLASDVCFRITYTDGEHQTLYIPFIDEKNLSYLFTHKMFSSGLTIHNINEQVANIKLYYDSIDKIHYVQIWENRINGNELDLNQSFVKTIDDNDRKKIQKSTTANAIFWE